MNGNKKHNIKTETEKERTQLIKHLFSDIKPIHDITQLNPQVKLCIKGLYKVIYNSYEDFFNNKEINTVLKNIKRELVKERQPDYFKKHDDTEFPATIMPKLINESLKDSIHLTCKSSFNILGRIVNLTVVIPNKSAMDITTKDYDNIYGVIQYVFVWLNVAYNFATEGCSDILNIYIYLTDIRKTAHLNSKSKNTAPPSQLTVDNVNSAFTWSCKKENTICVYRKEEWFKCFIHETFHNLDLDFSLKRNNDFVMNCLTSFININKDELNIYETYCELWATIISALFSACHYVGDYRAKSQTNDSKLFTHVVNTIEMETQWSLFQMAKILGRFNIEYTDLISKNPDIQNKIKDIKIDSDDTNVFSYYIVKAVCMVSLWEFIQWCIIHNTKILNFKNDNKSVLTFCNFIKELFISFDGKYNTQQFYKKICNKIKHIDDVITMRMTLFNADKFMIILDKSLISYKYMENL